MRPNYLLLFSTVSLSLVHFLACGLQSSDDSVFPIHDLDDADSSAEAAVFPSQTIQLDAFSLSSPDVALTIDSSCAAGTMKVDRSPLYIQLILDGSGSMKEANKWTALLAAVNSLVAKLTLVPDPKLALGISMFCDDDDPSCKGSRPSLKYPSAIDVPLSYADSILKQRWLTRIDSSRPGNFTPTYAALTGGYKAIENYDGGDEVEAGGKKVVVLVTDGLPTSKNAPSVDIHQQEQCKSLAAQKRATVPLFVVGIGRFGQASNEYDPVFLAELAQSGGTAKQGCEPNELVNEDKTCHFQITPTDAAGGASVQILTDKLIAALDDIRESSFSCILPILENHSHGAIDPTKVNLIYTDSSKVSSTVFNDEFNGWTYDDPVSPKTVILHGQACANAKKDGAEYELLLGCQTKTAH